MNMILRYFNEFKESTFKNIGLIYLKKFQTQNIYGIYIW